MSDRIHEFVRSDSFEKAWVEANRQAHTQLVAALTGEGDAVQVNGREVSVSLATMIDAVKGQLVDAGFEIANRIPQVDATFTILQSDDLTTMQNAARGHRRPLHLVADHRTGARGTGRLRGERPSPRPVRSRHGRGGLDAAARARPQRAPAHLPRRLAGQHSSTAAAGAVYDQVVSFIRFALRGLLIVALAVAIGAWLSSRSGAGAGHPAGHRAGDRRGALRELEGRFNTGGFGVALATYKAPIRVGVLVVAAVLYLSLDHPTTGSALRS